MAVVATNYFFTQGEFDFDSLFPEIKIIQTALLCEYVGEQILFHSIKYLLVKVGFQSVLVLLCCQNNNG